MNNKYGIDLTTFLQEIGLGNLSPEEQAAYSEKILSSLEKAIALRIEEKLSDADLAELDTLATEQVTDYLMNKGVDVVALAAEEGAVLREHLLSGMTFAQGVISEMKSE